jgi:hypothetical protein
MKPEPNRKALIGGASAAQSTGPPFNFATNRTIILSEICIGHNPR